MSDEMVWAVRDIAAAIEGVARRLEGEPPRPPDRYPSRLRALTLALRFCRNGGDSLAARFKRVPEGHVERIDGELAVACVCGTLSPVSELEECWGSCGRWFAGDESGVWAARL